MDKTLYGHMDWPRIEAVVYGEEKSPRDVMGPRVVPEGILVQCFYPEAKGVTLRTSRKSYPMERVDEGGYFAALIPGKRIPQYSFLVDGKEEREALADPYRFPCQISELDEKRFLAGIHYEIYEKLGAHPMEIGGVSGVYFALWAPNALRVSVVGEFNGWDGRRHPMQWMPASGIFELFIPGLSSGESYQYELKIKGGEVLRKGDPYAFSSKLPPETVLKVADLSGYPWGDSAWQERTGDPHREPLHILEVDLLRWKEGEANYRELAEEVAAYASEMGYTHVELLPVMEHLEEESLGYAAAWYYAPTKRLGEPQDFMAFVDRLHQEGIGVILDWPAAHFPAFNQGLSLFDGTCLYEHEDPRRKFHPMWGTLLFDLGSPLVKNFLIANAFFWMREYHVDGLRADDVDAMLYLDYGRGDKEWAPNFYGTNENLEAIEFFKHLHSVVRKEKPNFLFIAQEDGLWPGLTGEVEEGCIGFDFKWNQGFTQDFLDYLQRDFHRRQEFHDQLTFSMVYGYCERYVLTLGRRDVQDFSAWADSLPGDEKERFGSLKAALGYFFCHPGKKMTLPLAGMGEPFTAYAKALYAFYRSQPALYELDEERDGFSWIQLMKDRENMVVFLRMTQRIEDTLLVIANFSPTAHEAYPVGVPYPGKYKEIFNSDREAFGGRGRVNPRVKMSKKEECDNRENSISVRVPPLGICIFSYSQALEPLSGNTQAKRRNSGKQSLKKELQETMRREHEALAAKGKTTKGEPK